MATCKNCGRTWDFEYSEDLCGAFCDGAGSQKMKVNNCRTADGQPYGPGSKVYYIDPTGYVQGLDVGVSFRTDSSVPEPVYHPYPVYSSREAAELTERKRDEKPN